MTRRMNKKKTDKLKKPSDKFLKFINHMSKDQPEYSGDYLCYVKDKVEGAFPLASTEIIHFDVNEGWENPYIILAWFGPLPELSLDELDFKYKIKNEKSKLSYFIGTEENVYFDKGPFCSLKEAMQKTGNDKDCIFIVDPRMSNPKIKRYWDSKNKKWIKNVPESFSEKYCVSSLRNITKGKTELMENIIELMKKTGKKGDYIFSIKGNNIEPIWQWNNGWVELSNKKKRKIKQLLGV